MSITVHEVVEGVRRIGEYARVDVRISSLNENGEGTYTYGALRYVMVPGRFGMAERLVTTAAAYPAERLTQLSSTRYRHDCAVPPGPGPVFTTAQPFSDAHPHHLQLSFQISPIFWLIGALGPPPLTAEFEAPDRFMVAFQPAGKLYIGSREGEAYVLAFIGVGPPRDIIR